MPALIFMFSISQPKTLIDVLLPQVVSKAEAITKDVVLVLSFSILTAFFSQISFWVGIVPITGQTFIVLLSGILLGSVRGGLSQIIYLFIGLSGIPFWFAAGGPLGIARLMGPTGGYLLGFVFAAFIVGKLAEIGWSRSTKTVIPAMIIGNVIIYFFGLLHLAKFISWESLFIVGLSPFILGDLLKILLAGLLLPAGWKIIKR